MHFKVLFPSQYLAAHDLNGHDVPLTIRHLVVEDLKTERGTERKPVLYFVETQKKAEREKTDEKRMVLNKTNAKMIAKIYGPETDDWKGKRVTVFATMVSAFGAETEAIRVRPVPPPVNPTPATPAETKPAIAQ